LNIPNNNVSILQLISKKLNSRKLKIIVLVIFTLLVFPSFNISSDTIEKASFGNWTVITEVDEFTNKKSIQAKLKSRNTINGWLSKRGKAFISVHCGKYNNLTFIAIGIEGGVGFDNAFMDFKVDDNDGVSTYIWNGSVGDDVIFSAVGKGAVYSNSSKTPIMLKQMKSGEKIKVRINPFNAPRQVAEFNLQGSAKALSEVENFCSKLNQ